MLHFSLAHFTTNIHEKFTLYIKKHTTLPHHAHFPPPRPPPSATMDGGDKLYKLLLDRCHSLEASHEKLQGQFNALLQEQDENSKRYSKNEDDTSYSGEIMPYSVRQHVPGVFFDGSPHRKVLDQLGHAVHVSRPGTGEITFWNLAAEKLYGYKDYEVLGQRVAELLIDEQHHASAQRIRERLKYDRSWSGQFPYKKKCGRIFMALVTKSLLYEDGELVGIITVSSDAAIFNKLNSENVRIHQDPSDGQSRFKEINPRKTLLPPYPEIASSVPNLESRVILKEYGGNKCTIKEDIEHDGQDVKFERPPKPQVNARPNFVLPFGKVKTDAESSEKDKSRYGFAQPSKIAAKVLSKLHIGGISNLGRDKGGSTEQDGYFEMSVIKEASSQQCLRRTSEGATSYNCVIDCDHGWANNVKDFPFASKRTHVHLDSHICNGDIEYKDCRKWVQSSKLLGMEDDLQRRPLEQLQIPNAVESMGGRNGNISSKGKSESKIRWEDLSLREEIGEGAYGIVYRGIWNGSDVAVKVYHRNSGNQCTGESFLDYKKEIDIMRRLRHPNVLLFMGAVYSEEKLAVVTEFMPRGSLFKTLHKSNQPIEIKRRLLMALDVARGMNYLHHRNPPIVHRDLKSSNLLVDKSWTVKVGDFGLSRLKNATFLSTKSGRGTPQWMAPEVLRSEPSTEKSDVFSFGVILWELMTLSVPWVDLNSLQVVGVVGFMDRRLDIPENMDPRVSSIIHDCWLSNSEHRPSFEELIGRMTNIIQTLAGVTVKKIKGP